MNRRLLAGVAAVAVLGMGVGWLVFRPFPAPVPAVTEKAPPGETVRRSISIYHLADPAVSPPEKVRRVYSLVQNFRQTLRNRGGPPLSSNREFTAALTGRNALKIQFLPPDHPSISAEGELLDAWDTPYFFHILSADSLEVLSAGPDRIAFNADDIVFPPPRPRDSVQEAIRSRRMPPEDISRPGRPPATGP